MIYAYQLNKSDGTILKLSDLKGKVILFVNTATRCGFTPQYDDLERLYEKYHEKGLEIIDIPCNQFGMQAPGTDEEIHQFCTLNFNTKFMRVKKADVNGPNELPIYKYLKAEKGFNGFGDGKLADVLRSLLPQIDPNYEKSSDIKWNFTKFLINQKGEVVARFEPTYEMTDVEKAIATLLA